jgi:hypothetical protein
MKRNIGEKESSILHQHNRYTSLFSQIFTYLETKVSTQAAFFTKVTAPETHFA